MTLIEEDVTINAVAPAATDTQLLPCVSRKWVHVQPAISDFACESGRLLVIT